MSASGKPSFEAGVRALAPAKLNLVLEVLGRRADGYHDIDTVMTTIDLADVVRLRPHDGLEVRYEGAFAGGLEGGLEGGADGNDLVTRAARALADAAGREPQARIEVTKSISSPAGLGGGSSDAAAALRGLNALWGLDWPAERLAEVGASIGSDVPFFVYGGNAHCSGRGETVEPLRDLPELRVLVLVPPLSAASDKTARRYAELQRSDFSDGERSRRLAYRVARGAPPPARDLYNTFEAVIERTDSELMGHLAAYRAAGAPTLHLCGSGPAAFLFVSEGAKVAELRRQFREAGAEVFEARTLRRADALRLEPLEPPAPVDPCLGLSVPDDGVLQALLAGLIAGSVMAFGSTAIAIAALWRSPGWLSRAPNLRVPLPLVGVVLVNGFLLGWTALGLVLGAAFHAVEGARPDAGLGSPNAVFTAGVVAAAVAVLVASVVVRGRPGWPMASMSLLAALSFGWLLPWLAPSAP